MGTFDIKLCLNLVRLAHFNALRMCLNSAFFSRSIDVDRGSIPILMLISVVSKKNCFFFKKNCFHFKKYFDSKLCFSLQVSWGLSGRPQDDNLERLLRIRHQKLPKKRRPREKKQNKTILSPPKNIEDAFWKGAPSQGDEGFEGRVHGAGRFHQKEVQTTHRRQRQGW